MSSNRDGHTLVTKLVEVVIAKQNTNYRAIFHASVLGIPRDEKRLTGKLGRIPLRVGDCLLLATGSDFTQHLNIDRNFHLLGGGFEQARLTPRESTFTLTEILGVIVLAVTGAVPLFPGLLFLLGALLALRVLRLGELRRRFPFELFMIIGSALSLAEAMDASGGTLLIASFMQ